MSVVFSGEPNFCYLPHQRGFRLFQEEESQFNMEKLKPFQGKQFRKRGFNFLEWP